MSKRFIRGAQSTLVHLTTVLCLTACITVGHAFPTQAVPTIAIGKATQADIQKVYGSPFRTGLQDGDVTWTYVNYKLRVFGDQCTQDLVVRFASDGTVKSFTYNTTAAGSCTSSPNLEP